MSGVAESSPRLGRERAFDAWWSDLQALAQAEHLSCMLATKEDHRSGFERGNTPDVELAIAIADAQRFN